MRCVGLIYMLSQTYLSIVHGLCQSDHPFPNTFPILYYWVLTMFKSNLMIKAWLYESVFSSF